MRGYLKDHVGVFEPDEVVTLLAAFDKSWGLLVDVDISVRTSRGSHAQTRLRGDARGGAGGARSIGALFSDNDATSLVTHIRNRCIRFKKTFAYFTAHHPDFCPSSDEGLQRRYQSRPSIDFHKSTVLPENGGKAGAALE
jgi:hypothetical protein